jgi:hypothetical protein
MKIIKHIVVAHFAQKDLIGKLIANEPENMGKCNFFSNCYDCEVYTITSFYYVKISDIMTPIRICDKCRKRRQTANANCAIFDVRGSLPELVTERHDNVWLAYLKDIPGMVVEAETEDKAIDELMISIKVKLLYDRQ